MEIRESRTYDESEILPLYESVGWTAYTENPEVLQKGFESSMLTLAAYGYTTQSSRCSALRDLFRFD